MTLLEQLLQIIAPHNCVRCDTEGTIVCADCWASVAPGLPSRCYRCNKVTISSKTCPNCRRYSKLSHVWVRTQYDNDAKDLVHKLKFERAKAIAEILADY